MEYKVLQKINSPEDLKQLPENELEDLCKEMRECILNKVSKMGGHLGPNLGVVELAVAMHRVFQSPIDKFVWDISHQCYSHKLLTGRREIFESGEAAGFTDIEESEHDFFNIGHTSTSVSLACGLAKARDLKGEKSNIIAVIGDGSLSGGEAYEGLDNAGDFKSNFIVIINDNERSIAENHGGIYKNLAELRNTKGEASNNIFKALGFNYKYVAEGNNVHVLIQELEEVKDSSRPIVVHIHTKKGNSYVHAEQNPERFHWTVPFSIETGMPTVNSEGENYNQAFVEYLTKKVQEDNRVVAINAATPGALGLCDFREKFPEKYFDVGIAEEHAVAFASGLASQGMKPIATFVSSFIQRAYDQISQDLCINKNPAILVVANTGISDNDKTHLAIFDIPLLSNIPNFIYMAPKGKEELVAMLEWAMEQKLPVGIRLGGSIESLNHTSNSKIELNTYEVVEKGNKIAILGLGNFFVLAEKVVAELAKQGINATLINPRFMTGIDKETLTSLMQDHDTIVTLEDGILEGGFGEKIARFYGDKNMKVYNFGAQKEFTDRNSVEELYHRYHLEVNQIVERITK